MNRPNGSKCPTLIGALFALAVTMIATTAHAQATYESVFEGYVSFREKPAPIDWRTANEVSGGLGGFVGQMRASPRLPEPNTAEGAGKTMAPERMWGMREMMTRQRESMPATGSGAAMPAHSGSMPMRSRDGMTGDRK